MTTAVTEPAPQTAAATDRSPVLAIAAFASIAAGAIHAAAIGSHAGLSDVVAVFTASAVFQIGWGVLVLTRPHRTILLLGIAGNLALLFGWAAAMSSGISFVEGMDVAMSPQRADSLAAGLAAVAVLGTAMTLARPRAVPGKGGVAVVVAGLASIALGVSGMAAAASPDHHGDGTGGDHSHDGTAADDGHAHDGTEGEHVEIPPFDPALPINLSGMTGVSPEQQARAENLLAATLLALPRYADPADAEADGYFSIGDGSTGYEHYMNWGYAADGSFSLDPYRPESLVYQTIDGTKTLVAAMYIAPPGTTLDTVPDLGGPLTQWHIHDDLCFTPFGPNGETPVVAAVTASGAPCPSNLVRFESQPMVHVWITPHPCGPFAALEGVGGGQIAEDEERLCDHTHGSH